VTTQRKDKFRGILLGMACGDALGAQVEFKQRGSFPEQRDMTGKGPHNLKPGQWTDDTAMALILAEYMRDEDPNLDKPAGLADRWVRWMTDGVGSCTGTCFDIGGQTRSSLAHWAAYGKAPKMKDHQRGNGALMRVAPVVLAHFNDDANLLLSARRQALVTHGRKCADLCQDFVVLLEKMIRFSADDAKCYLSEAYPVLGRRIAKDVDSSGYDVATFEAAIWCVMLSSSLEEAVMCAANLGDDADTVAAVTGALAGAVWGASDIPSRWLKPLAWGPRICGIADSLYERSL
jgi:ADP-ribosyl-[dinitrogen reductase] hydrolase